MIGGPIYFLAKFLAQKLKPLVGHTYSFVKEFCFLLLVSFNVVSLYKKIPINEAISVINRITDDDITNLVGLCHTSSFFSFQGEFHEHACGVSMGSLLSLVIANLLMEDFETKSLERFVDDTCVIWPHGHMKLDLLLHHLNSQSNSIKFTMEVEVNGCLPFLDVLLYRLDDGSLSHRVFRKKNSHGAISSCELLPFPTQNIGVLNTLATYALIISDVSHL